jgi:hypothetical protein
MMMMMIWVLVKCKLASPEDGDCTSETVVRGTKMQKNIIKQN